MLQPHHPTVGSQVSIKIWRTLWAALLIPAPTYTVKTVSVDGALLVVVFFATAGEFVNNPAPHSGNTGGLRDPFLRAVLTLEHLMRLGIATKVFIAFAGVTLIFSMVLMFGIYRTQALHGQLRALNHRIVPLSLHLSDIQSDLKSFHVILNERDPSVLRRTLQLTRLMNALPDQIDEQLLEAANLADLRGLDEVTPTEIRAFQDFHLRLLAIQERGAYFSARTQEFTNQALGEAEGTSSTAVLLALQDELREEARHLDTELGALRAELQAALDQALIRADATERNSVYGLGLLSLLALSVSLVLMFVVLLTLRPLTALTEASKRIGAGDYRPIDIGRRRLAGADEITLLAREFNTMAESLAERDARLRSQHEALLKSERLATIGQMTSVITHELRNPLSSINLNAEMLMDSLHERGINPDDPEVMPLLQTIIEEVDRLRDITEEYLVYARLPSPKLSRERIDDIIQSLVDFHIWEWNQHQVAVDLHIEGAGIEVHCDSNQLRQALLNILKNAIEASPEGATVRIAVKQVDDSAFITIADEGVGFDESTRERIFEPFFTTKGSGTGLGLPMTQQIVEEHHGELAVHSEQGRGTIFEISLPLATRK